MLLAPRSRFRTSAWLVLVIALGLGSRARWLPRFSRLYLGDVLWGTLFFWLAALACTRAQRGSLWLYAVIATECIEFSQAYHQPWLDRVRASGLGGVLLGHEFLWSDVICVALGATLGVLLDWALTRARP
jgi:hypothetical protein